MDAEFQASIYDCSIRNIIIKGCEYYGMAKEIRFRSN